MLYTNRLLETLADTASLKRFIKKRTNATSNATTADFIAASYITILANSLHRPTSLYATYLLATNAYGINGSAINHSGSAVHAYGSSGSGISTRDHAPMLTPNPTSLTNNPSVPTH